jgi:hypothetical protein
MMKGVTKERFKMPVRAGMRMLYPGTTDYKIREVGYDLMEIAYKDGQQIAPAKRIKRVLYKNTSK